MAHSSPTTATEATKATTMPQPPVPDGQFSPEPEVDSATSFGQRAVHSAGGSRPQTPPDRYGTLTGQMGHAPGQRGSALRQLQRGYGNQYVGRVIQAKLTVGQPGDVYEREADRVADQIMRMPEDGAGAGVAVSEQIQPLQIQRMCTACEEEDEDRIHRKETGGTAPAVTPAVESRLDATRGGGQPLPDSVRAQMEPRFGADFSGVRVHAGGEAATLNRDLKSQAFTRQRDIYFGAGKYSPESSSGQRLLAHELTHVMQQNRGIEGLQTSCASDVGEGHQSGAARNTPISPSITSQPQPPDLQRNGDEEHTSETKEQFAERVHARAASRLTRNIGVLDQWKTYINAMEGFQLRAQLLTTRVAGLAATASPTPSGRQRFEDLVGTRDAAERRFREAELDIEATYQDRVGSFMGFLESRAVTGYWTTPSIAENFQVLAGDRTGESLPAPVYVPPDPRYSAYADTMRRVRSGEIGGCQTCHEINLAWRRTADIWGDPLPRGDFGDFGRSGFATESLLSEGRPRQSDSSALMAYIQSLNTTEASPSVSAAAPSITPTTSGTAPNPFVPTVAVPQGVEVPPPRTGLCGSLPDADDSQRIPSLAEWGPNSAIVADVIARIDSVLTPLGPRGYRVLERQNFDALYAMSPDNMESVREGIITRINNRMQQYSELRTSIQSGLVPYEELCPIVDELMPSTNEFVRWQAQSDVRAWQEREQLLNFLELTLIGLSFIFPPSAIVTVPAGMALGLARISLGIDQKRQGRQWSQGIGAGVYSLAQEAQAPGLTERGEANIRSGAISFGLSALTSGLVITRLISEARANAQFLQMLQGETVIQHAQHPGTSLIARNGRLLMIHEAGQEVQILGFGKIENGQLFWTRLNITMSRAEGSAGASSSLTPFFSPSSLGTGGAIAPFSSGSSLVPAGGTPLLTSGTGGATGTSLIPSLLSPPIGTGSAIVPLSSSGGLVPLSGGSASAIRGAYSELLLPGSTLQSSALLTGLAARSTPSVIHVGGTGAGTLAPNIYNPCGRGDNCGFTSIAGGLEYQNPALFRDADLLYAEQLRRFGISEPDALSRMLLFPEPRGFAGVRPRPGYEPLFTGSSDPSAYTISSVAQSSGLRVTPTNDALTEWRTAFGRFDSLDEAVDARLTILQSNGLNPSEEAVRRYILRLRDQLPGMYIIGSRGGKHFMTLSIGRDGQITGFDYQNMMSYQDLDGIVRRMEGNPIDLLLKVDSPVTP